MATKVLYNICMRGSTMGLKERLQSSIDINLERYYTWHFAPVYDEKTKIANQKPIEADLRAAMAVQLDALITRVEQRVELLSGLPPQVNMPLLTCQYENGRLESDEFSEALLTRMPDQLVMGLAQKDPIKATPHTLYRLRLVWDKALCLPPRSV